MKLDVTDAEILSFDSGVITCPVTQSQVPALFMTVRITGQPSSVNLAIRKPFMLVEDLPLVMGQSRVLSGDGEFVPEHEEDDH